MALLVLRDGCGAADRGAGMTLQAEDRLFLAQLERQEEWHVKALEAVRAAKRIWEARLAEDAAPSTSLPEAFAPTLVPPPMPNAPLGPRKTPERVALLQREYPTTIPTDDILARFNALPGRPLDKRLLGIFAAELGLRRPSRSLPSMPDSGPAMHDKPAPIQDKPATAPVPDTAIAKALQEAKTAPAVAPPSMPLPAPVIGPRPVAAPPAGRMAALTTVSKAIDAKAADEGPIVTTFETVAAWAGPRGIPFATWDDLPAVNRKRDQYELRHFARLFGRGK